MGRNFPRKSFGTLLCVNHLQEGVSYLEGAKTSGSRVDFGWDRSYVRTMPLRVSFIFEAA